MLYGYAGRIVRVNLTTRKIVSEDLPIEMCRLFIGGKGFGTKIIYDEIPKGIDPFSPENVLVVTIGPASGTRVPFSSKLGFYFKSPLTGIYGESHVGGYAAPKLKWAGIDALIISGRASKPVYLYIYDGKVELKSAMHLLGKTTYEKEIVIKEEIGDKDAAVMEIGPAGENLVRFASICHANGWRQAGRCGGGAVMGSKRLEAIAVSSDRVDIYVADNEELERLVRDVYDLIKKDPVGTLAENYRKYGTPVMVAVSNSGYCFPTEYWKKVFFEKYENIDADEMSKYLVKNRSCWNCPFACGKLVEIEKGPYRGIRLEGPEYETIFAIGGLCLIDDFGAIIKINDLCDMYGLDTITMGNVAGFAIEAYRLGKLKSERPLRYSDPEGVMWLIEKITRRESVGNLLAEGVKKASEVLGLESLAVHSKGLELPGYDPRTLKGMALAYATSPRGACHLRAVMYAEELSGTLNRFEANKKKAAICVDNENKFIIYDTLHLCRFARKIYTWSKLVTMINALTGFGCNESDVKLVAERINTLARMFNVREGISKKDDTISGKYIRETVKVNETKVQLAEEEIILMVEEYYKLRGWDKNGLPTSETLKRLGLA